MGKIAVDCSGANPTPGTPNIRKGWKQRSLKVSRGRLLKSRTANHRREIFPNSSPWNRKCFIFSVFYRDVFQKGELVFNRRHHLAGALIFSPTDGSRSTHCSDADELRQVGIHCDFILQSEPLVSNALGISLCMYWQRLPWFVSNIYPGRSGMMMMISSLKDEDNEYNNLVGVKLLSVEHQEGRWMSIFGRRMSKIKSRNYIRNSEGGQISFSDHSAECLLECGGILYMAVI